jgi:hypothetical protein
MDSFEADVGARRRRRRRDQDGAASIDERSAATRRDMKPIGDKRAEKKNGEQSLGYRSANPRVKRRQSGGGSSSTSSVA